MSYHTQAVRGTEKTDKQVRHLMKLQREFGTPQRYFIGASGHVRVAFNGDWWEYDKLAAVLDDYKGWEEAA